MAGNIALDPTHPHTPPNTGWCSYQQEEAHHGSLSVCNQETYHYRFSWACGQKI